MLRLLPIVLCCCCVVAHAADNPYAALAGTYIGEVYNGADLDAVVTTFTLAASGRISGSYTVDEENGAYSGTLSNIVFDAAHSISMEWTDKFGEGFAVMEFNEDFSVFNGAWTDKDGSKSLPWDGHK